MEFIPIKVLRDSGVKFTEVKSRSFHDEVTERGVATPRLATPRIFRDAETLVNHFQTMERNGYNVFLYEGTDAEKAKADSEVSAEARSFAAVFGTTSSSPRRSR